MIQTFDACDELLLGTQTLGQAGLGEPFLFPEVRDSQGKPGREIFGFEGFFKLGIFEISFETVSKQSPFHGDINLQHLCCYIESVKPVFRAHKT